MVTILKADVEDRKQRRMILIVLAVAVLAFTWAGLDYYDTVSTELLPEDIGKMDDVLARWKADGFVREFRVGQTLLVVDQSRWESRKRVERMSIVTQLARYCAERNKSTSFILRVQSTETGPVLAEMGLRGLRVP
jgi:hypothetical protein